MARSSKTSTKNVIEQSQSINDVNVYAHWGTRCVSCFDNKVCIKVVNCDFHTYGELYITIGQYRFTLYSVVIILGCTQ